VTRRAAAVASPLALAHALLPDAVAACAVCLDAAWGDRGFNVAFVGLMLAPFAVAAALAAALAWGHARRGRGSSPADAGDEAR
jgi:hypothetical protein